MKKIKLLCDWKDFDGNLHAKGAILEVDESSAELLVAAGKGEYDGVVKSKADDSKQTDSPAPITRDDIKAIVKEAVSESVKSSPGPRPVIKTHEQIEDDPCGGYPKFHDGGFGLWIKDIHEAGLPGGRVHPRLKRLASTISKEAWSKSKAFDVTNYGSDAHIKAVGSDEYTTVEDAIGGFFVPPPEFRTELLTKGIEPDFYRGQGAMAFTIPTTMMKINSETDTTRTGDLFGGVQVYFQKERAQMTLKRGEFEQIELKPHILTGFYPMTDQLLQFAPQMSGIIGRQFRDAITFREMKAFVRGDGAGEPLGFLPAGAAGASVYSVSKETGQAAATINTNNILNMVSRMRPQDRARAVWLAGPDALPQLETLSITVGVGGAPLKLMNINQAGENVLYGRPVIFTEQCSALGTVGDIALVSMPHYLICESTYQNTASSIHFRFDYNETVFRMVKTVDGQPWWRSTLTLRSGWVVSWAVVLATRA